MYVIMGGTGHVGSETVIALLNHGQAVTVVTRDADRARRVLGQRISRPVDYVEADVEDVASLRAAFRRGRRAFLLNPNADPGSDTDAVERRTIARILEALEGCGLEKVVAASTGGAQPGERLGDLNVLWEFERGLGRQAIPAAINRGAYYMSNWDGPLESVQATGKLPTMFPADLPIPAVAPRDLGMVAAERLMSSLDDVGVRHIEGPVRYSSSEVAAVLSDVLDRPVKLEVTPRSQLKQAFMGLGFSGAAADSYARMTAACIDNRFELSGDTIKGATTLESYVREYSADHRQRRRA
jgi:uncharacterized protein YbjT (DUF2867 family)